MVKNVEGIKGTSFLLNLSNQLCKRFLNTLSYLPHFNELQRDTDAMDSSDVSYINKQLCTLT